MSIKSGPARSAIAAASRMGPISAPKICIPTGRSYSKISSFIMLFAASRIKPSELINSVYIRSAPYFLHTALKGGSLTSSIGASNRGNSPNSISAILTKTLTKFSRTCSKIKPFP